MSQLEAFVVGGMGVGGWVPMPISGEKFMEEISAIGVIDAGTRSLFISKVEPKMEALRPHLQPPFEINELNFFAAKLEKLEELGEERQSAFEACLQDRRHCGSVPEMINLLENIDCVDLQPAFSPAEYGAFQINLARGEFADIMDELEQSPKPEEQAFFAYIAEIESKVDLAAYGKMQAENESGAFTDYGYITETAPFHELYRGTADIPKEFQVSHFPSAMPLLKLESADLTDVMAKIHDLSGHAKDLDCNLEVLHRRRSSNFLLLITEEKAILSEAAHVYREGTEAHNAFVNATEPQIFSIYVTDFQQEFIAEICEVDSAEHRADILDHSIHFVNVKAVTMENESVTFTPEEWKNVGAEERDSFQSWARKFADGDYTKVLRHIDYRCDADNRQAQVASPEQFFSKLEHNCPAKAEHTPEMRQESVLQRISVARIRNAEPLKTEHIKHNHGPER